MNEIIIFKIINKDKTIYHNKIMDLVFKEYRVWTPKKLSSTEQKNTL